MTFGSIAWAERGGGALGAGERLLEAARAVRAQLLERAGFAAARVGIAPRAVSLALADLPMPRTALARAAEEALAATPSWIVAHSMRTWAWGALLAARDGAGLDAETFFAAALLHDLGLATEEGAACFAQRGGELARRVCEQAGAPDDVARRVADAICMHLNVVPGGTPEAHYVRAGTGLDVVGDRFTHVSAGARREVVSRWPREGFAAHVTEALEGEARRHPGTRVAFLCDALGFSRLIARADRQLSREVG